ncbi:hypothetical protein WME91_39560 [Sorangium sp. So ce269]
MSGLLDRDEAALGAHVREAVERFCRAVAPGLRAGLDAFFFTRNLDIRAHPLRNFTRAAQPVVHLPIWTARVLVARGVALPGGALEAAVDAAVFGYLCAQVEDDGLEGRLGQPALWVLLAHALFAWHQSALVSAAGANPVFWSRYSDLWLRYAGAASVLGGAGPDLGTERASALDRAGPLVLPAGALLMRTGDVDLLSTLEELVQNSTDAAQLFDDLIDASTDLQHGRKTYVVRAMAGEQGEEVLRRRLYLEGGFEAVIDEALAALQKAEDAASALGMTDALRSFGDDKARIKASRHEFLTVLEKAIFG